MSKFHTKTCWYREPLVWMLIAIPLAAVIGGTITFYLAVKSDDGLVADDYYQRGKEINRVLARDEAAAAHALKGSIDINFKSGRVAVELSPNTSYRLPPEIQLQLLHSTRAGFDQVLMLQREPSGLYGGNLPTLSPGHWHLQLEADDWRLTGSMNIPASKQPSMGRQIINL